MKSRVLFNSLIAYNTIAELEGRIEDNKVKVKKLRDERISMMRRSLFRHEVRHFKSLINKIRHINHENNVARQAIYFLEGRLDKSRLKQWTGISSSHYTNDQIREFVKKQRLSHGFLESDA